ncbi:MAG: hypothetical protein E7471_02580, partial [Ruminococcaceae bacterium]|nr:hypothetical protein [Oscillospiraceae bacterium]
MKKRIFSLLLALSMIVALIPAQTFAAGELTLQPVGTVPEVIVGETEAVEVSLYEGSAQSSITRLSSLVFVNKTPSVADVAIEHTGDGDGIIADFAAYAAGAEKTLPSQCAIDTEGFALSLNYTMHDNFFAWEDNALKLMMLKKDNELDVTVDVPKAGYYAVSVQGLAGKDGALCEVYVGGTKLGVYSFETDGELQLQAETQMGILYLQKGENTVTFKRIGGKNYLRLSKVGFIPVGDSVNFNVTGKQIGTAEIFVTGNLDGAEISETVQVPVKGIPGILATIENETALEGLYSGTSVAVKLAFTLDGLPAPDGAVKAVKAEAKDPAVLTPSIENRADGAYLVLDAHTADSTDVEVTLSNETYGEKVVSFPVSTKGREYVFDLRKVGTKVGSWTGVPLNTVTDWGMTTIGHPNEIHPLSHYTDPWIYVGEYGTNSYYANPDYGLMVETMHDSNWISYGIEVDTSGSYELSIICLAYASGTQFQTYVAPFGTENPRVDKYRVGDLVLTYSDKQLSDQVRVAGNIYLEKGRHVVSFQAPPGANTRANRLAFSRICLNVPTERTFDFGAENTKFMIEEDNVIEIVPRCNQYPFTVEKLSEYTVTNLNEDVLTYTLREENGKIYLDARGLKPGVAEIQVDGTYYDGTEFSRTFAIETVPRNELLYAEISVDTPYTEAGGTAQLSGYAVQYDGEVVNIGDDNVEMFFASSDKNIFTIDENGVITGRGMGRANATIYARRDGIEVTASLPFEVTSYYPLTSAWIEGIDGIELGAKTQYRVSGKLENGARMPDTATIKYSIVSNPEGAIELDEDTGLVSAKAEGTAVIQATATMVDGSSVVTPKKTITVYYEEVADDVVAEEILIDMVAMWHGVVPPKSTTLRQVTMADFGWEVNTALTSPAITAETPPSVNSNPDYDFRFQIYGGRITFPKPDNVLVFNIKVPVSGYYELEFAGYKETGNKMVAEFFMNDTYLGEYSMWGETEYYPYVCPVANCAYNDITASNNHTKWTSKPERLNGVYLSAGIHQLYVTRKALPGVTGAAVFMPGTIRLIPTEKPTRGDVSLTASQTTFTVGQTGYIYPGTQLSNGRAELIGYDGATREVDPNNCIISLTTNNDCIVIGDNYGGSHKITPKKPGTTTVTMVAMVDGVEYTKTLDITVDGRVFSDFTVALETPELHVGEKSNLNVSALYNDGSAVEDKDLKLTYTSLNEDVAKVVDGVLETYQTGTAQIKASATMGTTTLTDDIIINVLGPALSDVKIKSPHSAIKPDHEGYQLSVVGISSAGAEMPLPEGATVIWSTTTPDYIDLSETGFAAPKALGNAIIKAEVNYQGNTYYPQTSLLVREGKSERTYYTEERLAAMRDNIEKYDWAREVRDTAIQTAEDWFKRQPDLGEYYVDLITTQEFGRGILIGHRHDPMGYHCKFCNVDLRDEYSNTPYIRDTAAYPWKIQCPNCRRRFPSNDFGSFYKTGIDEHGNFSYEKALRDGQEFLVNEDFPEKDEYVDSKGIIHNEGVHNWGVDDSRGYVTGKTYEVSAADVLNLYGLDWSVMEERWTFAAYYNHYSLWRGDLSRVIEAMENAYIYTGDKKYGRVGAILIDRIADVLPEMYTSAWFHYSNSDGNTPTGRIVGSIWNTGTMTMIGRAYDAFYDMYDDEYVLNFISNKAKGYNFGEDYYVPDYSSWDYDIDGYKDPAYKETEPKVLKEANDKSTPALIRYHIEKNMLKEIIKSVYDGDTWGNWGMHQASMATAAVVLDEMPTTSQAIDWLMESMASDDDKRFVSRPGGDSHVEGGDILNHLAKEVFRDGSNAEGAPNYSRFWPEQIYTVIYALAGYEGYQGVNLLENPKMMMMFKHLYPLIINRQKTASLGDSGTYYGDNYTILAETPAIFLETEDVEIGQLLYWNNGNTIKGLHGSIFEDSNILQEKVQKVIDEHGEYDFDRSEQATGWGFSIVRNGTLVEDNLKDYNTQRYNYIYAGYSSGHGNYDKLDFSLGAFGIDMAPDFGYPEAADGSYRVTNRDKATISHNTVIVNNRPQDITKTVGFPLHFDDSDRVSLIDMRDLNAYSETSEYRRSAMMIEVDDMNAYTVDFFRIIGGDSHLYNFHAATNTLVDTDLDLVKQKRGTYGGEEVQIQSYDKTNNESGFDMLYNVQRAEYPGKEFTIDYLIDVFKGYSAKRDDYHLKMTMLNDFDLTEVAVATIQPPQKGNNPVEILNTLVRRDGKDLDTLFTTVFEPYNGESFIEKQESVSIERVGGAWEGETDTAKAIKITLKNGRVDYIVYASNNKVLYKVDDLFEFKGFVGVYMKENENADAPMYLYMNDGTKIDTLTGIEKYTGTIVDFTKEDSLDNRITVKINESIDPQELVGQYIYVNNDGVENGVYPIQGVNVLDNGNVELLTGMICYVRSLADQYDIDKGYAFNIAEGQTFIIPLATTNEQRPVWEKIENQDANVGSMLRVPLKAIAPDGATVTYELASELRGANVVGDMLYYTPDNAQLGINRISVVAKNGIYETVTHFEVEVNPSTAGGGGGGGGGGSAEPEDPTYEDLGGNIYKDEDGNIISAGPDKTPGTADDMTAVKGEDG